MNLEDRDFIGRENRTTEYEAAISALRKLSPGMIGRAYSEVMAPILRIRMEKKHGPRASTLKTPVGKFIGVKGDLQEGSEIGSGWGADHVRVYRKKGEKYGTVTSEPYGMPLDYLRGLVKFCDAQQLDCLIDTGSPHFASACLLVTLSRPASEKLT